MTRTRYIKGTATHRRTECDYMAAMLDSVTLVDWRDIIGATVQAAKSGDAQERAFIASYLVGKPEAKAPTAVSVVVAQLSGRPGSRLAGAAPYQRRAIPDTACGRR